MLKENNRGDMTFAALQFSKERKYWLEKFSGQGEWRKTHFPYDYRQYSEKKVELSTVKFECPAEIIDPMKRISGGSEPKLYMMLTAAVIALLHKYTAEKDITVGAPIYKQDVEGRFINTVLALRNRFSSGMSFKELLIQVRETVIEANKNQNYPIERLLHQLGLSLSNSNDQFPLFDVIVLLENIHDRQYIQHINCDVIFSFHSKDNRIEGTLSYDSLRYERSTIERIPDHYNRLLKSVFLNINTPLARLDILSGEEKKQLLYDFGEGPVTGYPTDKTLQELFVQQAAQTPDNIALIGKLQNTMRLSKKKAGAKSQRGTLRADLNDLVDGHLSYRELNQRANRWAWLLREKGVKADTIVGIMVEPSIEMIVGILAILKAGGAYLPMEANAPTERMKTMMQDSDGRLMLTGKGQIYPPDIKERWEMIDLGDETLLKENDSNPPEINTSAHLAYAIYTSGSTGKPKGVLIQHKGILNYIFWRIKTYNQTGEDVTLQLISVAFDGFGANLYPTLLSGGKLVMIDRDKWNDTGYLRELSKQEKVTNFSVVPSWYRFLLAGGKEDDFKTLRFVVLAGDKTDEKLAALSRRLLPGVRLINEYGPTENSVTAAANCEMNPGNVSIIGNPVANIRAYIMNEDLELLPPGAAGELCISGSGLARGYLNHPELTLEKFDHDLWEKNNQKLLRGVQGGGFLEKSPPGRRRQRLYKTGDIARWKPDGTIEILGRVDSQLNLRGFRVEPGEIENRLLDHDYIKEAVVIPKKNQKEETRLYAYLVTDKELGEGEIREYLLAGLPDYMVPARFVCLEEIPLSPNGKVDRQKLIDMGETSGLQAIYTAPRTPTEEKLAQIWKDELELEKVGIKDNYFNIGGDSIKSISLLNLVNETFETKLKIVDLYSNNTIEQLALKIEQSTREDKASELADVLNEVEEMKNRILKEIKGKTNGN